MPRESDFTDEGAVSRRGVLRAGLGATAGLAVAGAAGPGHVLAGGAPDSGAAALPDPYQGRPLPMPIPYINPSNGQHTFGPTAFNEPSNIDNFRGQVGVMNVAGTGHDGGGTPLVFGGPTMDMRFQQGEYITADGAHHQGSFVHI